MKSLLQIAAIFLLIISVGCGEKARGVVDLDEPLDHDIGTNEEIEEPYPEPEMDCPLTGSAKGFNLGDVMVPVRVRNAEREIVALKDFCGSKALLIVSSAAW